MVRNYVLLLRRMQLSPGQEAAPVKVVSANPEVANVRPCDGFHSGSSWPRKPISRPRAPPQHEAYFPSKYLPESAIWRGWLSVMERTNRRLLAKIERIRTEAPGFRVCDESRLLARRGPLTKALWPFANTRCAAWPGSTQRLEDRSTALPNFWHRTTRRFTSWKRIVENLCPDTPNSSVFG